MGWPPGSGELFANGMEGCRVSVVPIHVTQQAQQLCERRFIKATMFLDAVPGPGLELVEIPPSLGHTDDRRVEVTALDHGLQCRKDLLVGKIARSAEEHQRIGMSLIHHRVTCLHRRITCRRIFPRVRRTGSAWPRVACSGSPLRRAS